MQELKLADVEHARFAISRTSIETPLIPSPHLTQVSGTEVLLKLELAQPIGAFKLRGAANAIFNLPQNVTGVTCSSTGNHGRAVAYAAKARGLRAVICMSSLVPRTKVEGIKELNAEVRIVGTSQDDAQAECDRLVQEDGLVDISPFDDPHVIAGQGTIALELLDARPDLETLLVPLAGGGLAGGIALAAKARKPRTRLVGITMDRGAAMHESIRAGSPVDVTEVPSLADSLGGGIGHNNQYSLDLCSRLIDELVLVSEEEIYRAIQTVYYEDRIVCEGGSAVGVAALKSGRLAALSGPIALIVTGRNIDMTMHGDIVQGRDVVLGDYVVQGQSYRA